MLTDYKHKFSTQPDVATGGLRKTYNVTLLIFCDGQAGQSMLVTNWNADSLRKLACEVKSLQLNACAIPENGS